MSRTTDARQAIQDLLESSDPETVIQYDGITYRVAPSVDKREGFYEILTQNQAQMYGDGAAAWLEESSETWLRSARYNASLEATTSDQQYPTSK